MLVEEKKTEFVKLFQEFVAVYVYTPDGLNRRNIYIQKRQSECRYIEAILVNTNFLLRNG
jgi:hypothetical protein